MFKSDGTHVANNTNKTKSSRESRGDRNTHTCPYDKLGLVCHSFSFLVLGMGLLLSLA